MAGGVFVIQADESLVELAAAGYDTEDVLQGLLAKYPSSGSTVCGTSCTTRETGSLSSAKRSPPTR